MTRERLEQYESLMQELTEEQERLAQETRHARWIEETYGVGCLFGVDYLEQSRARVRELSGRRTAEQHEVRGWIDGVRDSMTRRALRLRYLDGPTSRGEWDMLRSQGRASWWPRWCRRCKADRWRFHGWERPLSCGYRCKNRVHPNGQAEG